MLVLLLPIVSVVLALAAFLLRRKAAERERTLALALESAGRAARHARRDADASYRSLIDNAADVITVLELTESAVMRDVVTAARRLDALKELGVRIGVDDFGEGHSSLAYLASLPLDLLKIPKSFVDQIGRPDANQGLVRAIVELARSFGLRTIAEGIEEREQIAPLLEPGCELAQGYLFARPADAAEIAALAGTAGVSPRRAAAAPRAATRAS
jgi:EAL domain-containing protein (putative c-di-GMP-specific phosphodiesterase class I)